MSGPVDILDTVCTLLAAASTAAPELRVVYVAEARIRLAAARGRVDQCTISLEAIEQEIARVARVAAESAR